MHELELLQSIYARSTNLSGVTIGPGDDMGEIKINSERLLCAVDQLVVGTHVTETTNPKAIGRKAIARCFSDIAAMAGSPVGCVMSACVPTHTPNDWCDAVFGGAKEAAELWGGPLFGGDIASSDGPAVFSVTALATPPTQGAVLRTGIQEGDFVCVTGELGNSIVGHHLSFNPRIQEAQELLQLLGLALHCMIDISDGLGQDASHLSTEQLQLVIDTSLLPLREGATVEGAVRDGEDYELLFTSSAKPPVELATVIGTVEQGTLQVVTTDGTDISNCGWMHK